MRIDYSRLEGSLHRGLNLIPRAHRRGAFGRMIVIASETSAANATDPEGHLAAAAVFGTLGYFLYNTEQRQ